MERQANPDSQPRSASLEDRPLESQPDMNTYMFILKIS